MHLWPSLRIRDSFKHAYLEKLELNLSRKKRAQGQGQDGDGDEDKGQQQAPLLEDRPSPRSSLVASAVELAWDAALLLTCCCCCFFCGGYKQE